jgi:hypothetical protein
MLKLIAILTGCCLTLAVSIHAAEPTDQVDPKKQPKPKNNPKQQQALQKQQQLKTPNANLPKQHVNRPVTNTPNTTVHTDKMRRMVPNETKTLPAVQSTKIQKNKQIETTNQQHLQTNTNTQQQFQKHKLNHQQVQTIRAQHHNFHAQVNTSIASVRFNQSYRITNAQNWNGPRYNVFRSYQPQWHDQGWYRSRYGAHLTLIGGGWYFWNAGYWYPAWGYNEAESYYPYDGPIYSGPSARPADQVVADVQAALQEQGYYKGEVDGLLGPLTRQALADYQTAAGLYATETIDEPTLESLGLS